MEEQSQVLCIKIVPLIVVIVALHQERIIKTGSAVRAANIGVGLSIVNGRNPHYKGRLKSQTILSGISERVTNLTLLLGEIPAICIVTKTAKTETNFGYY